MPRIGYFRMKLVLLPRDGIGSTMDMDRKGCTLEKVASLVLVRVRGRPSCPFCLDYHPTLIEQEVDQPLKAELLLLTRMGNCSKVASLILLKATR